MIKVVFMNLFNFGLVIAIFFLATGFCAVWVTWDKTLIALLILSLVAYFILMEIAWELVILLFFCCRNSGSVMRCLFKFVLGVKNLRNYD
jgi:hypothetical protein